jgi:hypothetical protein
MEVAVSLSTQPGVRQSCTAATSFRGHGCSTQSSHDCAQHNGACPLLHASCVFIPRQGSETGQVTSLYVLAAEWAIRILYRTVSEISSVIPATVCL